jgi:hypothetical protein
VAADQARFEDLSSRHLLPERIDMLRDGVATGQDLDRRPIPSLRPLDPLLVKRVTSWRVPSIDAVHVQEHVHSRVDVLVEDPVEVWVASSSSMDRCRARCSRAQSAHRRPAP